MDYAKLYRREHRRRVVQEEKLRRVNKVLAADFPKNLMIMAILLITGKPGLFREFEEKYVYPKMKGETPCLIEN
jgi:hypothetical protein